MGEKGTTFYVLLKGKFIVSFKSVRLCWRYNNEAYDIIRRGGNVKGRRFFRGVSIIERKRGSFCEYQNENGVHFGMFRKRILRIDLM
jgi:hypothetical protein